MKNPFKKSTAATDIEAEVARMKAKRADAERRLELAGQDLAEAKAARLETLDGDDAAIEAATNKIRAAQSALSETEELIRDFDHAIAGAEQRLLAAKDREGREAEAKKLEKVVVAIEKRRPELEKAVAALASVALAMIRDIPPETGIASGFHLFRREDKRGRRMDHPLSGREAVYAAIVDGICEALPDIEESFYVDGRRQSCLVRLVDVEKPSYGAYDGVPAALPVGEALDKILLGRLKTQVAAILAGDDKPDRLSISPPPPPEPEKLEVRQVEIFARKDFAYVASINAMGRAVHEIVPERKQTRLPEPVATAAVKAGVAYFVDTHQGRAACQEEQERLGREFVSTRVDRPSLESSHNLGDVLDLARIWREELVPLRAEEAEEAARAVG